ncbi:SusD/RagB family nutrient-binding outer membrane lipoprotein [uncultured Aquimarina sp.]|uniref:SusD/RagB family nutrient-binding outer membrane lipoprotein n=1 Tax=uncultured Aquimarina sp. TaxID=575652 RepID=UPI002605F351|nr:SusD/RagB family nutrient-binding outer membrane lipoprotein [uncultured Aquimarina sp.]
MKKIKNNISRYFVGVATSVAILLGSCDTTELDLTVSPNTLSPESADPNFILNQMQIDLNRLFEGVRDEATTTMRLANMFGAYQSNIENTTFNAFAPPSDDNVWTRAYRINGNRLLLESLAEANPDIVQQKSIGGLITAYTFTLFVDIFGDIPFSEANDRDILNPSADDQVAIYEEMFLLIDESISALQGETSRVISNDLFYANGGLTNWIKFGNTLKLKMYNQISSIDATRATTGINALIAGGNLMETASDDFQFSYTTDSAPAESRHPYFTENYLPGGAAIYMSNDLMRRMRDSDDPRLRYYFYRQSLTDPSGDDLPCTTTLAQCYIGGFYWGREHTNAQGIPADNLARTIYGIYPGGGAFDNDNNTPGTLNTGLNGAGINPILLSSYAKFIQAEAAITLGTTGDPRTLLEEGVRNHIAKVMAFGAADAEAAFIPSTADVDTFVNGVLSDYDAATTDTERQTIIIEQYYITTYGNGIEAFNFYRRTGLPELEDPIDASPFPRSFIVPGDEVNVNPNFDFNQLTDQVFWDNNPAGFID